MGARAAWLTPDPCDFYFRAFLQGGDPGASLFRPPVPRLIRHLRNFTCSLSRQHAAGLAPPEFSPLPRGSRARPFPGFLSRPHAPRAFSPSVRVCVGGPHQSLSLGLYVCQRMGCFCLSPICPVRAASTMTMYVLVRLPWKFIVWLCAGFFFSPHSGGIAMIRRKA